MQKHFALKMAPVLCCYFRLNTGICNSRRRIATPNSVRLNFPASSVSGMLPSNASSFAVQARRGFAPMMPRCDRREITAGRLTPSFSASNRSAMVPNKASSSGIQWCRVRLLTGIPNFNRRRWIASWLRFKRAAISSSGAVPKSMSSAFAQFTHTFALR